MRYHCGRISSYPLRTAEPRMIWFDMWRLELYIIRCTQYCYDNNSIVNIKSILSFFGTYVSIEKCVISPLKSFCRVSTRDNELFIAFGRKPVKDSIRMKVNDVNCMPRLQCLSVDCWQNWFSDSVFISASNWLKSIFFLCRPNSNTESRFVVLMSLTRYLNWWSHTSLILWF